MKAEFSNILELLKKEDFPTVDKARRIAEEHLPERLGSRQVQEFLNEVRPGDLDYPGFLGIVLSVAVSRLPKGEYRFIVPETWKDVDFLFSALGEDYRILLEGTVGNLFGWNLKGATLVLKGDAGHELGAEMESGEIEVHGNVGDYAGSYMKGGRIVIHGNAGRYVGHRMTGGSIVIEGKGEETKLRHGGELVIKG